MGLGKRADRRARTAAGARPGPLGFTRGDVHPAMAWLDLLFQEHPKPAEAYTLRRLARYSERAAAERLGVKPATIRSRIKRAVDFLADYTAEVQDDGVWLFVFGIRYRDAAEYESPENMVDRTAVLDRVRLLDDVFLEELEHRGINAEQLIDPLYRLRTLKPLAIEIRKQYSLEHNVRSQESAQPRGPGAAYWHLPNQLWPASVRKRDQELYTERRVELVQRHRGKRPGTTRPAAEQHLVTRLLDDN